MNVADSEMLAEALSTRGYALTSSFKDADLLVINTCSVRERAEKRALARITEYSRLKEKAGKRQVIWVVGCMAERLGERLKELVPGIDRIIGATKMEHIANNIDDYLEDSSTFYTKKKGASPVSCFLPIMRGCDNYCAYCIVPFVRGREHSVAMDILKIKTGEIVEKGTREIVLLGQNVNSYRDGGSDFPDLIRKLHYVDGLERIRFTTSHPKDLSEKLINTIAELPKVCKHIHLPVQSGSTRILGLMNRKYTREDYLRLIERIRTAVPEADITTDVMTGFPTETDRDFEQTVSLFKDVRFTTAFMFAFSIREGTAAGKMDGQIPQNVKKERLNRLVEIQTEITKKHYEEMTGRTVSALFCRRQDRGDRFWMGQDYGSKRVLLNCDEDMAGMILNVKIVKSTGMTLIGERI